MKAKLTNRTVSTIKPSIDAYDVRDTEIKGFLLRVRPSGSMTYLMQYRNQLGKQQSYKIGLASNLKPAQARDIAEGLSAKIASGIDIQAERKRVKAEAESLKYQVLGSYIEQIYKPWVMGNRKGGEETLKRLERNFGYLFDKPISEINSWIIEKWRSERQKSGVRKETVNRDLVTLKAALSQALKWGIISDNPISKVKPLDVDGLGNIRYLSQDEEKRLRKALNSRDIRIRSKRISADQWREQRGYTLLPDLLNCDYADHLTPIILLTINTGLRRGEVFDLTWEDVNINTKTVTVRGDTAKNGNTRHLPLNVEAINVIKSWKKQSIGQDRVFPAEDGGRLNNIKNAWGRIVTDAKIQKFRFHDIRHTFASNLVMRGVPLNTVRELLGHKDLKTTLRYAHLAPDHKSEAVNLLDQK